MYKMAFVVAVTALSFALLVVTGPTQAQCPTPVVVSSGYSSTSYPVTTTVHKPVKVVKEVVAPVAVPVVIPATVFQYVPALTPPPVVQYTQQPAPVAAPPAKAAPTPDDIDRLLMQRLDKLLKDRLPTAAPASDGPPPIKWGEFAPPQTQEGPPAVATTQPAVARTDWVGFLKNNCASCHGGSKKAGGITLFDTDGNFRPNTTKDAIVESIVSGAMPKGNPMTLTADQSTGLRQWARE